MSLIFLSQQKAFDPLALYTCLPVETVSVGFSGTETHWVLATLRFLVASIKLCRLGGMHTRVHIHTHTHAHSLLRKGLDTVVSHFISVMSSTAPVPLTLLNAQRSPDLHSKRRLFLPFPLFSLLFFFSFSCEAKLFEI